MKLTEKTIATLVCADGQKDRLVFDDALPGLGVRVSATGGKNFLVQFRTPTGGKGRLPIGAWGSITLEQARLAAKATLGKVAAGRDPYAERSAHRQNAQTQAEADRLTLKALLADWAEIGLVDNRESYRREAVRAVSVAFAPFLNRRAEALQRTDAVRTLDAIVKAGKGSIASRTLAYGRACYSWAVKRGRLDSNPFSGLPIPSANTSRDRVLTDNEIGTIFRNSENLGFPFGPLFQLLMLTAQRRDEVAGIRWSEISNEGSTWTIPASRAKNGKAHVVHLTSAARAIIAALPRSDGSDLVFTTNGRTHVSGFSKARERLGALISANSQGQPVEDDWRLHDFRRTCVSWLAGAGFSTAVADKILNHTTATGLSTVGQVYQRQEYLSERKRALEAWTRHVEQSARDQPQEEEGNILTLKRR